MKSARAPVSAIGGAALVLAAVAWHAQGRTFDRGREQPAIDAIMRLLPAPDLSFAGSARHLRFPSLEEPGAAFADVPAGPDLDPAGAAVAPPTAVYTDVAAPSLAPLRPFGQVVPR